MSLSTMNIDVIRYFNGRSYGLNDVLFISIHYFCNISSSQNESDKRYKPYQGCTCVEEAD